MSKRQRTDTEVITACDLADAIEEIQDVVPSFSIESVLTHTKEVARMLKVIPDDVKHLYSLLKSREWYLETYPSKPADNVFIEIYCPPSEQQQVINVFQPLGFKVTTTSATYVDMLTTYQDPCVLATWMALLRDKDKNPMLILGRDYTPNTTGLNISVQSHE